MNNTEPLTLIVGASGSLGTAIAARLSAEHYQLVLTYFGSENYRLPDGVQGRIIKYNVVDGRDIGQFIGDARINNVIYSVSLPINFRKFEDEQWQDYNDHWQTQVGGLWHIVHALLQYNHPLRNIIAIGSSATDNKPMARLGPYTTTKYALLGLVKTLAVELAPLGININMVSPHATGDGLTKTWPNIFLQAGKTTQPTAVAEVVVSLLKNEHNRTGENIII